jgi:rhodanese-related sulfurtransferase
MSADPEKRRPRLAIEVALVLAAGGLLAIAANALSPRGLALGRDYFPPAAGPVPEIPDPAVVPAAEFATVTREEVLEMTRDPRFASRRLLLLDARNDELFNAGHIPGALQFDHFRPEKNLVEVHTACLMADRIVIYCGGGSCDDSLYAARMLRDLEVPAASMAIYTGGFHDWRDAGLPVKTSDP